MNTVRTAIQAISAILLNSNLRGFAEGSIYRGNLKNLCVPVLNCYSCPGAIGSCPVGSLQAVASGFIYQFSFYVAGFLGLAGIFFGRLLCGWICPFGLIQDLLHKIPSPKFILPAWMRYIKHFMLFLPVLFLPALISDVFGLGVPYYCKWLCPAGTLEAAIPLYLTFPPIRSQVGMLFTWRILWLLIVVLFIILIRRGFCQALCPLGSFYSFFNRFSYYTLSVDRSRCTSCHSCKNACYMSIPVYEAPNHPECIRCLECINKCPSKALSAGFKGYEKHISSGGANFEK